MFLLGDPMNPQELVLSWLLWHQAVKFLQHDIPLVQSADVRFPKVYADSNKGMKKPLISQGF